MLSPPMKVPLRLLALLAGAPLSLAQIPAPVDAPKPLAPEQSAAAFQLPAGFRIELVASEPLISSPSGICWDERGRLFVTELHGYNLEGQLDIEELNKTGKLDTQVRRVQAEEKFKKASEPGTYGVVKLLRDSNGDGRMDTAEIWSTNLPPAYGLVPARRGVIVACAPHILYLADLDGDGKAEVQETLFTGFRTGPLERGINAPQWGIDGWIYFGRGAGGGRITGPRLAKPVDLPGSDFRIREDGSAIEPVTGATGTFGFAMTEAGDRFTMSTVDPGRQVAPLSWRYLARNPNAAASGLEVGTGDSRVYPLAPAHPWRTKRAQDPAYFKFYRDRYGASDSDAAGWFTSACSPLIYEDSALPGLRGNYFVCEPSGNLIHRAILDSEGSLLKLRRAPGEEHTEFAASRDSWSHPMNLSHGPDGSIWIVDYYREIIEDYSAIPRHLQQIYGVYQGYDRGRIYRLTHRAAPISPAPDLSRMDPPTLALELASPYFWRRQTAQRLLAGTHDRAPEVQAKLRELLTDPRSSSATRIACLYSLDQRGWLQPADLSAPLSHSSESVRIRSLQLADRWFNEERGRSLFEAALKAVESEKNPRVLLQLALSLGESRDPRALRLMAIMVRQHESVRWMDNAILSGLSGRAHEMLAELLRQARGMSPFFIPLSQSIAARRDEPDLARALSLIAPAPHEIQAAVLRGLAQGRKNAPRQPLTQPSTRVHLATLVASPSAPVRESARSLEDTFHIGLSENEANPAPNALPASESISEEQFRKFVLALDQPRDLKRGHDLFTQACAPCHRIGNEGHSVGPDLLGQAGMAEEGLLKELLMPNERIRPGYESTLVEPHSGSAIAGILKEEGATSLTLSLPNGIEQILLRKDVRGVRRIASSLMPSFAQTLSPADAAHVLAWLKNQLQSQPNTPAPAVRKQ